LGLVEGNKTQNSEQEKGERIRINKKEPEARSSVRASGEEKWRITRSRKKMIKNGAEGERRLEGKPEVKQVYSDLSLAGSCKRVKTFS